MSNLSIILTKQSQNTSTILRKNFETGKYFEFRKNINKQNNSDIYSV